MDDIHTTEERRTGKRGRKGRNEALRERGRRREKKKKKRAQPEPDGSGPNRGLESLLDWGCFCWPGFYVALVGD